MLEKNIHLLVLAVVKYMMDYHCVLATIILTTIFRYHLKRRDNMG